MRLKRSDKDMFGNSAVTPPPAPAPARQQRSVPPGLVPFMPVIAIVLVLIAFLIAPAVGIGMLLVTVAIIIWVRYQDVKGVDYATMRSNRGWAWGWSEFARWRSDDTKRRPGR